MRIFYDHQATSLQDAGGVSRYHYELVHAFRTDPDLSIEYFLGLNASVLPFTELENARTRIQSSPTRWRPGYLRYGLNAMATAVHSARAGRFDIYHSTYQRADTFVRRRCLIATHHDSIQERYPHLFRNARAIQARKQRLYAEADAIICISEASRADLQRFYGVGPERTAVIHHGFRKLPFDAGSATEVEALTGAEPYILYVGSRWEYKNFAALVRAFAEPGLPAEVRLVAAGGGPWTREEVALLTRLRLQDRVRVLPRVSEAALSALYRRAALFVYPSLYEGFGFPPLEAMSEGCPTLVSHTSSMPEICGHAAFYFDPAAEGHLHGALLRLFESPEYRNSKREAGLEQTARYSWSKTAELTLGVYRRAVEGSPSFRE